MSELKNLKEQELNRYANFKKDLTKKPKNDKEEKLDNEISNIMNQLHINPGDYEEKKMSVPFEKRKKRIGKKKKKKSKLLQEEPEEEDRNKTENDDEDF